MLTFDQRYFKLARADYSKSKTTLRLHFVVQGTYTPQIPKHEKVVTKQILDYVAPHTVAVEFEYEAGNFASSPGNTAQPVEVSDALAQLNQYANNLPATQKVNKALPVHDVTYWLGLPIKSRPVQMKYLRVSPELQVTAGTIHFMKKREYKRVVDGAEVTKQYFTFMLDDGTTRLQCVHFPSDKTKAKFETLVDKTAVVVIGVHDKNNRGDLNFRVSGVALCDLG